MNTKTIAFVSFEPRFSGQGKSIWDTICYLRQTVQFRPILMIQKTNLEMIRLAKEHEIPCYLVRVSKVPNWSLFYARSILAKESVALIHLHGMESLFWGFALCKISRCPMIHTPHTIDMENRFVFFLVRVGWRYIARRISQTIAVSQRDKNTLIERGIGDDNWISVVYNSVAMPRTDRNSRKNLEKSYGIDPSEIVVCCIGRLNYQKNPEQFLQLSKRFTIPKIRYFLIGGGGLETNLRKMQVDHKLDQLEITGHQQEPIRFLARADVFVLCSRWEGLPYVLVEAAAMGIPAVASDVNGNSEVVEHGVTGFLYPPGDEEALVQAVTTLVSDEGLRKTFGHRARKLAVSRFVDNSMGRDLVQLYVKHIPG